MGIFSSLHVAALIEFILLVHSNTLTGFSGMGQLFPLSLNLNISSPLKFQRKSIWIPLSRKPLKICSFVSLSHSIPSPSSAFLHLLLLYLNQNFCLLSSCSLDLPQFLILVLSISQISYNSQNLLSILIP